MSKNIRKNKKSQKKSHKNKRRSRRQNGGSTSATTYVGNIVGGLDKQLTDVNTNSQNPGNAIVGISGQQSATGAGLAKTMNLIGGKHRKSRKSRKSKKGGFFGEVINNAAVPLTLLAMQQKFNPNTMRKMRTMKKRRN